MNVFEIIEKLDNKKVSKKFDKMIESNNLDKRIELCDEIITELSYLEHEEGFNWDEFVDELKSICIG